MTILVVDDEPLIAKGICHMIGKMDKDCHKVDCAFSGKEALEKLREQSFDLCLSDVCMPEMDGLELIKICRENRLCRKYCIISGYADFEYARQAIRLGVSDYLLKPIDKSMLLEMLQRFDLSIKIRAGRKNNQNPYVKSMLDIIEAEYKSDLSLSLVSGRINLNADYAGRLFKSSTNFTFTEYLNRYRLEQILILIKQSPSSNFEELAMTCGFGDIRNFYRVFKKIFNMTPGQYREKYLME